VGKEANEIEQIDAGVMETEAERMLVYDDGEWEAIQRVLKGIPTKELQRMTGYSRSMVKYLKSGERMPSDPAILLDFLAQGGRRHEDFIT